MKVESDSSSLLGGAKAMELTSCDPVLVDECAYLSNMDEVPMFLTAIMRRGLPVSFGTFVLRRSTVLDGSSFSATNFR